MANEFPLDEARSSMPHTIVRHWPVFVLFLAISWATAYLYVQNTTPKYTAKAIFRVVNAGAQSAASSLGGLASLAGFSPQAESNGTLIELLQSSDIQAGVVERLELLDDPYYAAKGLFGSSKRSDSSDKVQLTIEAFSKTVSARSTEHNSVALSVRHPNPRRAEEIADDLMRSGIVAYQSAVARRNDETVAYLTSKVNEAASEVEAASRALQEYSVENSATATEQLGTKSTEMGVLQTQRAFELAALDAIEYVLSRGSVKLDAKAAQDHPIFNDPAFRRTIGVSLTGSPSVTATSTAISDARRGVESRIAILDSRIKTLQDQAESYARASLDLSQLQRNVKLAEVGYEFLVRAAGSQMLSTNINTDSLTVIQQPRAGVRPTWPKMSIVFLFATAVGGLLGALMTLSIGWRAR